MDTANLSYEQRLTLLNQDQPKSDPADDARVLLTLMQRIAGSSVSESRVAEIVAQELSKREPTREYITLDPAGHQIAKITGRVHREFAKVLKLVSAGENVMLIGPAGCGKSHLAEQVADALGVDYTAIHGTAGTSESHLSGWLLPIGENGKFSFVSAQTLELYERGNALIFFDEIDGMDPNMIMFAHSMLANGHVFVPQRYTAPRVNRGPNVYIMSAANTYGNGADRMYMRNQLDAATIDRWYPITIDYDRDLELSFGQRGNCEWVWNIRERAIANKLRRVVSSRWIQRLTRAVAVGVDLNDAKRDLLNGWSPDEKAKVGE